RNPCRRRGLNGRRPTFMQDRAVRCSRRKFLASAAALTLAGGVPASAEGREDPAAFRSRPPRPTSEGRKPIAVIATVYRPLSHAYHIAGRFLHGYTLQGQYHLPRHYVRSMYVDQMPENDLSRQVGREFDVRVTHSVAEALTDA